MDTLTHIVLGACIGEALAGKQIGKKALLLGAAAQSVPDIDFLNGIWLTTCEDLAAHRGYTHSILFVLIITPFLASICRRLWRKQHNMHLKDWIIFWGVEIFVHILLDAFNAYGTGWFEPFSHYRISFHSMYVADPLFSIWPAIAMVALVFMKLEHTKRQAFARGAIAISSAYLVLGLIFKLTVDNHVEKEFEQRKLAVHRYFTTPTILNNMLWYVVAETDSGYYTGYRSIFDRQDSTQLRYVPRNASLLSLSHNEKDKNILLGFAQGYYTVEKRKDSLVFNIPRFGEITGWMVPDPKFAFYYYLDYPQENKLVVQRGRFANWNKDVFKAFLRRIGGN